MATRNGKIFNSRLAGSIIIDNDMDLEIKINDNDVPNQQQQQHPQQQPEQQPLVNSGPGPNKLDCSVYLEELREEYELALGDKCPCGNSVFKHPRRPSVTSNSSSSSSKHATSELLRIVSSLPHWGEKSVSKVFLQRITQVLSPTSI